jgi:hypothetical protein
MTTKKAKTYSSFVWFNVSHRAVDLHKLFANSETKMRAFYARRRAASPVRTWRLDLTLQNPLRETSFSFIVIYLWNAKTQQKIATQEVYKQRINTVYRYIFIPRVFNIKINSLWKNVEFLNDFNRLIIIQTICKSFSFSLMYKYIVSND